MHVRTFALLASASVLLSGAASWSLASPAAVRSRPGVADPAAVARADRSRFVDGKALLLEARLGRSSIPRTDPSGSTETFVLATVTGGDAPAAGTRARPPVHLAILVDRSGSMAGAKMRNAVLAAVEVVDRMGDGDRVTVVAFDTSARLISPPTALSTTTRPGIEAAIRGVQPGGETCISCALDMASAELEGAPGPADEVRRVLLISDGEATTGVRDVAGLRALASRLGARGFSISTLGVDIAFDEKVMAAIAQESNGKHWFLPEASALAGAFQQELGALETAVATGAEVRIEPAPGVVITDVLDRPFRREGASVVVPLGTFDPRQEKTVLLRAQVASGEEGSAPVARLALTYRDVSQGLDARCAGDLAVDVRSDGTAQAEIDPFVAARLERSRTARTLTEANELFEHGRAEEARSRITQRRSELARVAEPTALAARAASSAGGAAGLGNVGRSVDADFSEQQAVLAEAQSGFATPPARPIGGGAAATAAAAPAAKAVRTNQVNALDLAF